MFKKKLVGALLVITASAPYLSAQSYLFYLEAQGIAGWSSAAKKVVFHSMSPSEVMQKPSLGFDYVQRFSGASGDFAVMAIQGRLSVNTEGGITLEPQIYNAYLKLKTGLADIWIGHNKPKFGLSAVLDNHAPLLQPLSMMGYGFDRDWGVGLERDFSGGSAGFSLTAGSGMALKIDGSYFLAGRISNGVLGQDNFSVGFSAGIGRIHDVVGYQRISETPMKFLMAGVDLTWLRDNWEHNLEVMAGRRDERIAVAVFWRTGLGLLEESRLKLEAQPVFMVMDDGSSQVQLALGATYLAHPDWTLRAMVAYDTKMKDMKVLFQIYFYKGLRF
jgi:hypothetical protein